MYPNLAFLLLLVFVTLRPSGADAVQQVLATSTPARITIPSVTPIVTDAIALTVTPSITPTPRGTVMLQAKEFANVRAAPDIESERLGTIRTGELYPIIGRSFRWLQFQYDPSPSGMGWVYDELVDIIGNPDEIIDLNANTLPTVDTSILNITQTWEAITQTPGGLLTATAEARFIQPPPTVEGFSAVDNTAEAAGLVLPTFTYPPDVATQAPTPGAPANLPPSNGETGTQSGEVSPIVPIAVLGGLGLLGLLVSAMRK